MTAAGAEPGPPGLRPLAPRPERVRMVHLGAGAFFRAHTAPLTEDAVPGAAGWGICAVAHSSRAVADTLRSQDGLYSVLERSAAGVRARVVGAVREVLVGADEPVALRHRLADPDVGVVTVTVTEAGYRHDPATRRLRIDDPVLAADLAHPDRPARTLVGRLVDGLAARAARGSPELAVLVCDNVDDGGDLLGGLVTEYCRRGGRPDLADWVAEHVRFPSTVVDRIVPPPSAADRAQAAGLLGVPDGAAVLTEEHHLWVIGDDLPPDRPPWEQAGALVVPDVAPWARAKLRLVNAPHTALALLGGLAGHGTVAEATADDDLAAFVGALLHEELVPTVPPAAGLHPAQLARTSMVRFRERGLVHPLVQIATDTSLKIGPRLLGPVLDHRRAGRMPYRCAMVLAAWVSLLQHGAKAPQDVHAIRLREAAASADPARAVLSLEDLVPAELGADDELIALIGEIAPHWRATDSAPYCRASGDPTPWRSRRKRGPEGISGGGHRRRHRHRGGVAEASPARGPPRCWSDTAARPTRRRRRGGCARRARRARPPSRWTCATRPRCGRSPRRGGRARPGRRAGQQRRDDRRHPLGRPGGHHRRRLGRRPGRQRARRVPVHAGAGPGAARGRRRGGQHLVGGRVPGGRLVGRLRGEQGGAAAAHPVAGPGAGAAGAGLLGLARGGGHPVADPRLRRAGRRAERGRARRVPLGRIAQPGATWRRRSSGCWAWTW